MKPSKAKLRIDPGFVNYRKVEAIIGEQGTEVIGTLIERIPRSTPDWRKEVVIDQIYARVAVDFCRVNGILTLEEVLLNQKGRVFCSIVRTEACQQFYDLDRAVIECLVFEFCDYRVQLHLSTKHVRSDTLRSGLHQGGEFAVIAQFHQISDKILIFYPLVIGFPYLHDTESDDLLWTLYTDHYHVHLEDFDELSAVRNIPLPASHEPMRRVSESAFKSSLGEILSESTTKDWGGETSDFFTSHLHLNGERVTAAFLLKGPAKYSPMNLRHLGNKADQIVRLSKEPADVLIVQHCHDILPVVLEMLKVFATQPSNPRHYCIVDGRESLRLLRTYEKYEQAVTRSATSSDAV